MHVTTLLLVGALVGAVGAVGTDLALLDANLDYGRLLGCFLWGSISQLSLKIDISTYQFCLFQTHTNTNTNIS